MPGMLGDGGWRRARLRDLVAQLVDAAVDLADAPIDRTTERERAPEQHRFDPTSLHLTTCIVSSPARADPTWGVPRMRAFAPASGVPSARLYRFTTRSARACTGPATPFASVNCSTSTKRPSFRPFVSSVTLMR